MYLGLQSFQKEENWQLFNNLCVLYNTLQSLSIHYCVVLKCVFFSHSILTEIADINFCQ